MNTTALHRFPWRPAGGTGLFAVLGLGLLLAGCATNGTPVPDQRSAHAQVSQAIERRDCAGADAAMQTLDRHFPDGPLSTSARLQTAYTCIRAEEPHLARRHTGALVSTDASFTQKDYAHYLHAVAGYGIWKQGHRVASSRPELLEDIEKARATVEDFAVFVTRFPDSRYRDEALPYLVDLHEGLARSELSIARLDLERGEYRQAAARAGYVVEHFSETNSVSDARSLQEQALDRAAQAPVAVAVTETGLIASEPVRVEPTPPPVAVRPRADAAPPTPTVATTPPPPRAAPTPRADAAPPAPAPREDTATPAPAPAAVERRPAPASGGLEWVRAQPRTAFTIQVLGLAKERGVRDFLDRHPLDRETAWFRTERNGADWFVAIAGSYPNAEAARIAIASLPAEIQRNQPWIRSFASVQDAIR